MDKVLPGFILPSDRAGQQNQNNIQDIKPKNPWAEEGAEKKIENIDSLFNQKITEDPSNWVKEIEIQTKEHLS